MRSTYAIAAAIALAACGQPQIARPVSAPSAPQPTAAAPQSAPTSSARPVLAPAATQPAAAAPQNATSSARPWGPSEEEMSRTRGPGWILARSWIGGDRLYLHQTTMMHQGSIVQAWLIFNAWEPFRTSSGFLTRSSMALYQFDCSARLVRMLDNKNYSDRGASGDVRSMFVPAMAVWRPIEPSSIDELLMNATCQRRPYVPPHSGDTDNQPQPPSRLGPLKDPV